MEEMIGCLPWKFRALGPNSIAIVKRHCRDCGEEVALSASNSNAAKSMRVLCMACIVRLCPNIAKEAGGLVNGQKIPDLRTALKAAQAVVNRN
jgi:hypothetical protein